MGRLYHYTSQTGHDHIVKSGLIKQSQNFTKDCVYGDGVYLTTLNPEDFSKADLARNNYGGLWQKRLSDGRLDYYVEIEIPFSELRLTRCQTQDESRDVYLYTGDLELKEFRWQAGQNSQWTYSEVLGAVAVGVAAVGVAGMLGKWVYDYYNKKPSSEAENKENKKQKHCNR